MLITLQEIYFDLCDLRELIDAWVVPNVQLKDEMDLDAYADLRELIVTQIEKLEPFTIEQETAQ